MLYHISLEKVDTFTPRIPSGTMEGEDKTIKRICFSKSIEGAMTAMEQNFYLFKGLIDLSKDNGCPALLFVYSIDETLLNKDSVVYTDEVSKYVPDAEITNEVWLTEKIDSNVLNLEIFKLIDFSWDKKPVKLKDSGNVKYCTVIQSPKLIKLKGDELDFEVAKHKKWWDEIIHKFMEIHTINSKNKELLFCKNTVVSFYGEESSKNREKKDNTECVIDFIKTKAVIYNSFLRCLDGYPYVCNFSSKILGAYISYLYGCNPKYVKGEYNEESHCWLKYGEYIIDFTLEQFYEHKMPYILNSKSEYNKFYNSFGCTYIENDYLILAQESYCFEDYLNKIFNKNLENMFY